MSSPISFEEICPNSDRLLKIIETTPKAKLHPSVLESLSKYNECVVGEANHYDTTYANVNTQHCHQCYMFSVKFYSIAADKEEYHKQFDPLRIEFAAHWNKSHLGY